LDEITKSCKSDHRAAAQLPSDWPRQLETNALEASSSTIRRFDCCYQLLSKRA